MKNNIVTTRYLSNVSNSFWSNCTQKKVSLKSVIFEMLVKLYYVFVRFKTLF